MKDFRPYFKDLAQHKMLQSYHIIQHAILKSMLNPNNDSLDRMKFLAERFVRKAFTPISKKIKLDNGKFPYSAVADAIYSVNYDIMQFFSSEEEEKIYKDIGVHLRTIFRDNYLYKDNFYSYIFVRQDISPEYQAVQAAHAASHMGFRRHEAGQKFEDSSRRSYGFKELYFSLIGVPDVAALKNAIKDAKSIGANVYEFHEPDLGNELTAFATSPIHNRSRMRLLMSYKRLVFNK